jgi:hypothetical protein
VTADRADAPTPLIDSPTPTNGAANHRNGPAVESTWSNYLYVAKRMLLRGMRRRNGHARGVCLYSRQQFRRALDRERARTNRHGMPFSLLVFTPRGDASVESALERLARILAARLRITDEAGMLDDLRVGVILPATDHQGAWTVADDVVRIFPDNLLPPLCDVYRYPCLEDGNGLNGGSSNGAVNDRSVQHPSIDAFFARSLPRWKRAMDVLGALAGLVMLLPALAIVALLVRLSSPGPVIFRQWRSGLAGRRFEILKFRTMVLDAEHRKSDLLALSQQDGPAFKMANDPRVTRLGARASTSYHSFGTCSKERCRWSDRDLCRSTNRRAVRPGTLSAWT